VSRTLNGWKRDLKGTDVPFTRIPEFSEQVGTQRPEPESSSARVKEELLAQFTSRPGEPVAITNFDRRTQLLVAWALATGELPMEMDALEIIPRVELQSGSPFTTDEQSLQRLVLQVTRPEHDGLIAWWKWWRIISTTAITLGILISVAIKTRWIVPSGMWKLSPLGSGAFTLTWLAVGCSLAVLGQRLGSYGWRRSLRLLWGRVSRNALAKRWRNAVRSSGDSETWTKGALVSELESRFRYIYCFDFSGFDSSISSEMIDDAFGIAKTHLDLSVEDEDLWKRYVSDFIHSRLLSHTGEVYRVHRGVPSGSAFTSIVDSIVNLIAINYAWSKVTGHAPNQDRMLILGDDAVIASDVRIDVGELASAFSDLGLALGVGAGKTSVVDTHNSRDGYANLVHFLGRYWRNGEPVRPVFELLQRMVLPERHKARTREESILRFYSYLSDCKEAFYVFRQVYSEPDPVQAFLHALRDAGEHEIPLDDLPGALRFKVAVEGDDETIDMVRRHGLSIGMTSRLTA
jgi:hypothetical protein